LLFISAAGLLDVGLHWILTDLLLFQANPAVLQAMKAAAIQSGGVSANVNRSLNAAVVGEGVPRLRGVDERAARATAEARKKAAARGLNVRNGPVANHASDELAQILKLINAASGSSTPGSAKTEVSASEGQATNGCIQNGTDTEPKAADTNGLSASVKSTVNAPFGLGTTLESKKQKSKQKS
jgi:protein TIF31